MNQTPKISDDRLVAYLDNEADDAERAYIEAHPAEFAERLERLRSAENELKERLAAFRPISAFELGEYHLGVGPEADRERIAAYLNEHPHAAKTVDLLDQFLTELEPSPAEAERTSLLTLARVLIGRLVGDGSPTAGLAMGLRGEQSGVYQAGDYQVVVDADADFDDPAKLALSGLLTGYDEAAPLTVQLWNADQVRLVASEPVDEFGNFGFGRLDSGQYELIISGDAAAVEIHIQGITL